MQVLWFVPRITTIYYRSSCCKLQVLSCKKMQFFIKYLSADSAFPGIPADENQNGEDLQSAKQHIQTKNQLGKGTETSKIAGRTYRLKAGTHVVETAEHGGEVGSDGETIQTDECETDKQDQQHL